MMWAKCGHGGLLARCSFRISARHHLLGLNVDSHTSHTERRPSSLHHGLHSELQLAYRTYFICSPVCSLRRHENATQLKVSNLAICVAERRKRAQLSANFIVPQIINGTIYATTRHTPQKSSRHGIRLTHTPGPGALTWGIRLSRQKNTSKLKFNGYM